MKQLINIINKIWKAVKDTNDNMEEIMDITILGLLKEFCIKHLELKLRYSINIDELPTGVMGRYVNAWHEIQLDTKHSFYTQAALNGNSMFLQDCINTILHEFRHAWQYEGHMEIPKMYISGTNNFEEYWNQPIEIDARAWASKYEKEAYKYIALNLLDALINYDENNYVLSK